MKRKDLTGIKFGRLLVLEYSGSIKGRPHWLCKCDCGKYVVKPSALIMYGNSKSCGCLKRDKMTKHGMAESRIYRLWKNMMQRTNNKNSASYCLYGARGISVCEEWKDPSKFIEWALSNGYNPNAEKGRCMLDRIDNNKGYNPWNCRWVAASDQQRNRRNNRLLTMNGETMCITDWAKRLGCNTTILYNRIKYGWPIERILTEPVKHHNRKGV